MCCFEHFEFFKIIKAQRYTKWTVYWAWLDELDEVIDYISADVRYCMSLSETRLLVAPYIKRELWGKLTLAVRGTNNKS